MGAWEHKKAEARRYCRRRPELSPLYRIVASTYEKLTQCWEELFQPQYGVLRDEVVDAFKAFLECGFLAHGCARAECQNKDCKHSEPIAISCKQRCLCPSCDAKRSVIFAENLVERVLLPFPHQHITFSIPKRIRPFFYFNHDLYSILYKAAWQAWSELVSRSLAENPSASASAKNTAKEPIPRCGAVLALHSAGELLNRHPHAHGIFLSGAIKPDGSFVPVHVDPNELTALFAQLVLRMLVDVERLSQEQADAILSWPHSGFNVHIGDIIDPSDKERLFNLASYLKKCPLSDKRIIIKERSGETSIEFFSDRGCSRQSRTFTPLTFLAEVAQILPSRWEQTSRFFGVYSSKYRGKATTNYDCSLPDDRELPGRRPSPNWARLMRKIFEIDPLLCPVCGSEMKIKAFITDPLEIDRLLKHLKIPPQQAPPPLKVCIPLAA